MLTVFEQNPYNYSKLIPTFKTIEFLLWSTANNKS